jgi:hypothetical protein
MDRHMTLSFQVLTVHSDLATSSLPDTAIWTLRSHLSIGRREQIISLQVRPILAVLKDNVSAAILHMVSNKAALMLDSEAVRSETSVF